MEELREEEEREGQRCSLANEDEQTNERTKSLYESEKTLLRSVSIEPRNLLEAQKGNKQHTNICTEVKMVLNASTSTSIFA